MRNLLNIKLSLENLALSNLFVLCFFSFFGTGLPWQVRPEDYFELESTNLLNQVLYLYLFISSLPLLIAKFQTITDFIRREKYLTLFIALCLISFIWSDYYFDSIKRSFQLLVMFISVLIAFHFSDHKSIIKVIRLVVILYILTTLATIVFFKEAIDPQFNTWRGIHNNKNGLSQMGVICFILSLVFRESWSDRYNKLLNGIISIVSVLFVFKAGSSNSIIVIFSLLITLFIFKLEDMFKILKIKRTFPIIILLFLVSIFIVISFFSEELLAFIPAIFNKDLTLTGRTFFWADLFKLFQEKPLLGYGYGTFWVMGSSRLFNLFAVAGWDFNSAHNGYLDIALQLGLMGIFSLTLLLVAFVRKTLIKRENITILFLIYLLIGNLTESSFFLVRIAPTLIFVFFYIRISQMYIWHFKE